MNNNYVVYTHRNSSNGKQYIGQSKDYQKRWKRGYNGTRFGDIIEELGGLDKFEHIILKENLTKEQANYWEEYYIKIYDTTNPKFGYNTMLGRLDNNTKNNKQIQREIQKNIQKHKEINNVINDNNINNKYVIHFPINEIYTTTKRKFVICIETKDIFHSRDQAGMWAGLNESSRISRVIGKKNLHSGKIPNTQIRASWDWIKLTDIKNLIINREIIEQT